MRQNGYYDLAKKSRDRRFLTILKRLGYGPRKAAAPAVPKPSADVPPVDERVALRAEYEEVVGKRPFSGWDAETLRARIAAAREDGA